MAAFYCLVNAQSTPSDTLQVTLTDTTANKKERNHAVAESEQDTIQKFNFRFSTDGTASAGNVERFLLQTTTTFDWKPTSQLIPLFH